MIDWIDLKFGECIYIIIMNLPIKHLGQRMHESREKIKMNIGYGGQFLEMCELEFAKMP